jgi:hypothetical protein
MAAGRISIADYNHNDVLAASQDGIPAREHSRARESDAATNLIGVNQGFRDQVPVFRQEIRVMLLYVTFPLFCQCYLRAQIWTKELAHRVLSLGLAGNPSTLNTP